MASTRIAVWLAATWGCLLAGTVRFSSSSTAVTGSPARAGAGRPSCYGAIWRSGLSGADALLDTLAQFLVHVPEVPEGALEDGLGHAREQRSHDVADQPVPCGVVHHLPDQRAGLTPVVVLGVQLVGGAHHLAVGVPARRRVVHTVGLRAALGVREVHRVGDVVDPPDPVLAVGVDRRDRGVDRDLGEVHAEPGPVR